MGKTLSDKLQKIQNRAARVVTKSGYEIRSDKLLNDLNWDKLVVRRDKQMATLMFKASHGLVPKYIQTQFDKRSLSYSLRNQENSLLIPKPRTEYLKKSFSYRGAVLWNNLPSSIKEVSSVSRFRNKIESFPFE